MRVRPSSSARRPASSSTAERRTGDPVGDDLGIVELGPVVGADDRSVGSRPAEALDHVGPLHEVRVGVDQADGADRRQVRAAAELAQHGDELQRPPGKVVGQRHLDDAGEQRQAAGVGGGDHLLGRCDERVQPIDVGQLGATVIGTCLPVHGRCRGGRELGLARVPHLGDERRVEVAERAGDHARRRVAEHPATTEEVQPEPIEPVLLAPRRRSRA